ncbi:unnamed protein product [Fasciola hepatica]|uniref:Uncharacterized protein n=1 Tax=Fasciola hepatica TaxID=6192 RepID=A0ABC9HFH6_FASHE
MLVTFLILLPVFINFNIVDCQYLETRRIGTIKRATTRWLKSWETVRNLFSAIAESIRLNPGPNVEVGFTNYLQGKMLGEQTLIYTSTLQDIMELRGLMDRYNSDKRSDSTCNSAVNNLHIAVKHLDELMEKMKTRLHSPIENRVEVFYQQQNGNIYTYNTSSKLQINFINAMNAAKSATNNLLIDLQQLKLELVVDQI